MSQSPAPIDPEAPKLGDSAQPSPTELIPLAYRARRDDQPQTRVQQIISGTIRIISLVLCLFLFFLCTAGAAAFGITALGGMGSHMSPIERTMSGCLAVLGAAGALFVMWITTLVLAPKRRKY